MNSQSWTKSAPGLAENSKQAGYKIPNDLREADDLDLLAVDDIGKDQLSKIGGAQL
jgi:hypothetical protein